MKTEKRFLPVKLTSQELKQLADQAAENCQKLRVEEDAKKQAMAEYKEEIDSLNAQIRSDLSTYRRGTEDRPVEVIWMLDDPLPGRKTLFRVDTNELIETADMTDADKQMALPELQEA